jgi:hypothetical protein
MGGSVLGAIVGGALLLFLGALVAFAGYRLFLILLPIYGFFLGLAIGAHSWQALFGDGFLATTTSWAAGFFLGLIFAVLAYLFWVAAVAITAGSFGYGLVAAIFGMFGVDLGPIVWIVAMAVGIAFAVAALVLNLQKVIVIVATAMMGASSIIITFLLLFTSTTTTDVAESGAKMVIKDHPLWWIVYAVVALVGMAFQFQMNREYEIESYNRWADASAGSAGKAG